MGQALVYVIAFSSIPITFISVRLAYMGLVGINIDDTLLIYGSYAVEGVLLSVAVGSLYRHQHEEIRMARINAYTDSLCNLYNRRAFMDNLWHKQLPINKKQHYIMVIVDIDNLKGNNDTLGHDSGDQLIIYTAQGLKEVLDESMVFRLGGDEFALIYRTPIVGFDSEVRDLHIRFGQLHQHVKDKWPTSGISYGISVFNNKDDLPGAVRKADESMYNMKASKVAHE
jgi:diguanylate cyclase (GGDEF)-like protein